MPGIVSVFIPCSRESQKSLTIVARDSILDNFRYVVRRYINKGVRVLTKDWCVSIHYFMLCHDEITQ